ncbi:hypothetical protein D3C78_20470 [compost metagenome]
MLIAIYASMDAPSWKTSHRMALDVVKDLNNSDMKKLLRRSQDGLYLNIVMLSDSDIANEHVHKILNSCVKPIKQRDWHLIIEEARNSVKEVFAHFIVSTQSNYFVINISLEQLHAMANMVSV